MYIWYNCTINYWDYAYHLDTLNLIITKSFYIATV